MQFCSYSVLFTPEDIILKAYIVLLLCIPSALILGLLAEEKHIAKIIRNLSLGMKAIIDRLHPIGMVLLSVIVVNLLIPRYGILTIKYINPDTPTVMTQSEIIDELCSHIEQNSVECDFDYTKPHNNANKCLKTLILTKDELLKIRASEDKIEKAAKETREKDRRGNLEIIK